MAGIADNLKKLRTESGLTQEAVAREIGLTRQAISSYESGRTQPPVDLLIRFAELYGVEPEDVLYGRVRDRRGARSMKMLAWLTAGLWIGSFFLCGIMGVLCHTAVSPTEETAVYFGMLQWVEHLKTLALLLLNIGCMGLLILDLGGGYGGTARRKAACWAALLLGSLAAMFLWAWVDPVYVMADILPYTVGGMVSVSVFWGIDQMTCQIRKKRKQLPQ